MLQISSIMKKTRKGFAGISYTLSDEVRPLPKGACITGCPNGYGFNIQRKSEEKLWIMKTFFKTNVNKL